MGNPRYATASNHSCIFANFKLQDYKMIATSAEYAAYRQKYLNAPSLNLDRPVDISLELSSFCNMACRYCLDPETPVLMANLNWKPIKDLRDGDEIVGFDEHSGPNRINRKMRIASVQKVWTTRKPAFKIVTTHGEITCSLDHKFLDAQSRWVETRNLEVGRTIIFASNTWDTPEFSKDYKRGYLAAMTIGDGTARWKPLPGATTHADDSRRQVYWRIALIDHNALLRISDYLSDFRIEHNGIKEFKVTSPDHYKPMEKIEIRSRETLDKLFTLLYETETENSDEFEKGYLAGIFDSEGSYSTGVIRISQKQDNGVCETVLDFLDRQGFSTVHEVGNGVRIVGGKWENIRFIGMTQPAIERKFHDWDGTGVQHGKARILRIESVGEIDLVDITTSTRTFYGGGFPTHNCYHSDKKNLPFKQNFMIPATFKKIVREAAELGVESLKFNWRGESTMNPMFWHMTKFAKELAKGSTFIDRLTNSNFKFDHNRDDIFEGLSFQTKVKVSYDSFQKDVFETQRHLGNHELTTANIDKFYNLPGRTTELVIQAVRTSRNKDEDIEGEAKKRWPSAKISIRDMVEGRVNRDLSQFKDRERDHSHRQSCIQAHARLIFDWTGEAVACCPDIRQELKLGKIQELSVFDIFNSPKAKQLRADLLSLKAFENSPCKNCSSFETFKGYVPSLES